MSVPRFAIGDRELAVMRLALESDVGTGDVTTLALVDPETTVTATLLTRQDVVVSGTDVARAVFLQADPAIRVEERQADGDAVPAGGGLLVLEGRARGILVAERTALNFMQRMTGIATLTRRYVDKAAPHGAMILDTRKTTPGLRTFEKHAVVCGGGRNHRMGLYDRVLIKDNHRKLWAAAGAGTAGDGRHRLSDAVLAARRAFPGIDVEVEVEDLDELRDVLEARPEWVLLDNLSPGTLRECVEICGGRCRLEASGGITLDTVAAVAASGVDAISVGALTHSAPAADLSLEFS